MNWNDFLGNADARERFQRSLSSGRLASSFLFIGPAGIGKRTFALLLAKALLCEHRNDQLDICDACPACAQVAALSHPDLEIVSKPADKNFIPLDLLIGDDEHRMREGLLHRISLKAFSGGRKVAILDDADFLNQEGANCMLKTLEEPPAGSIIILLGTSEARQLPTIRSRCQVIRFQPLSSQELAILLQQQSLVESADEANSLAAISNGSIEAAVTLLQPDVREFREAFIMQLATLDPSREQFIKQLTTFVDAAGKDAALKRQRMRMLADWAILFYGLMMRIGSGLPCATEDSILMRAVASAGKSDAWSTETMGDCVHRCLDMHRQIGAFANQANMLEAWLVDLGKAARGEHSTIY
jgi:DNA polymerase-3 subunit delta'